MVGMLFILSALTGRRKSPVRPRLSIRSRGKGGSLAA